MRFICKTRILRMYHAEIHAHLEPLRGESAQETWASIKHIVAPEVDNRRGWPFGLKFLLHQKVLLVPILPCFGAPNLRCAQNASVCNHIQNSHFFQPQKYKNKQASRKMFNFVSTLNILNLPFFARPHTFYWSHHATRVD